MTDRVDHILASLAAAPSPPGLADIDTAVLGRIAGRRAAARPNGALAGAIALAAVVLGVIGGLPQASARNVHPLAILAPAYALAPSTLLGGDR